MAHNNRRSKRGGATLGPSAEIAEMIQQLTRKNSQLERMLARMGSASDNSSYREQLETTRNDSKYYCSEIIQLLKDNRATTDRSVHRKLTRQFEDALQKYTNISEEIERKDKRIVSVMSGSASQGPAPIAGNSSYQQQEQVEDVDIHFQVYDLDEIRKKEQGIKKIERDVTELSEMFQDLQLLVHEQQDSIDHIESNLTTAKEKTAGAHQELVSAEGYQKSGRKKQCCLLFLILGIVGAIVLGVIITTKK